MSSSGAPAAAVRVPFRFPFNPPANALPLSDANYLMPNSLWSSSQISTGVSALVRLAVALLATGAAVKLFRAPKPTRRLRPADLIDDSAAAANGKCASSPSGRNFPAPNRNVSASPAAASASAPTKDLDSSWATAGHDTSAAVEAAVHASAATEATSHADAAGHIVEVAASESSYESDHEPAAPATLSTPQRRRTTAPDYSHIDSIQKKERKSARKSLAPGRATPASPVVTFSSPSKTLEEQRALAAATASGVEIPQGPALPPFSVGIITPRSLQHYAQLLKDGFDALLARQESAAADGGDAPILRSVEICMPEVNESAATFSARIRSTKRFDVLLIQYHGSQAEDPIAFVEYSQWEETPRILLLHRPEEILQRHEQHVFKDAQFNVVKLLREVDVVVLLGEAARPSVLKQFAADDPGNVCVVPHGFSDLLGDEQLRTPKSLAPITVVGANTTWSDMRWLADLIELRQAIEKRNVENAAAAVAAGSSKKRGKGKQQQAQGAQQVLVYAAGSFVSYTHPTSKDPVDELRRLQAECPDSLAIVNASDLDSAAGITDVASLKRHLWTLSESGRKVVVCRGSLSARLAALHVDLFDFQTQLFRELMMDYRPKVEYSGSLHARPGAAIPIVFASAAMDDVEIEGMQLLTVNYPSASDADAPIAASSSSSAAAAAAAAAAAPSSSKWYSSASYVPDFSRAVDGIFQYLRQPSHFHSHRLAVAEAATQLSMRHIAAQYEQIIKVIFNLQ